MTTDTKTPGTGLTLTENAAVGALPVAVQQQLELRKLSNQIAGKLAELNWGQKLDLGTRRAIADWGRQYGVDPTTEINVLGGNIYLNAAYYLRRLAYLIEAGVVEYAYADHIEVDERLAQLGAEGEGEASRRLRERIKHQVPDKAQSAVAFRVKLRLMSREIVGVKWCGGGTQKNDPVGDAKPVETSESRAARRAMRQIVTHIPHDAAEILATEDAAETLSETIQSATAKFDHDNPRPSRMQSPTLSGKPHMITKIPPGDPYADPVLGDVDDADPGELSDEPELLDDRHPPF